MTGSDLIAVVRRLVELGRPDLRHYYRVVRKARVVRTYASDGRYWCDVQPLRNDESEDSAEPVVPKVEIPVIWAGPDRGIVCPPAVGSCCDLSYYDGDPNYPRISNFRWQGQGAPECEVGALVIQQTPEVSVTIDPASNVITVTPGDWTVRIEGTATIEAGQIQLTGPVAIAGSVSVSGDVTASGTVTGNPVIGCPCC